MIVDVRCVNIQDHPLPTLSPMRKKHRACRCMANPAQKNNPRRCRCMLHRGWHNSDSHHLPRCKRLHALPNSHHNSHLNTRPPNQPISRRISSSSSSNSNRLHLHPFLVPMHLRPSLPVLSRQTHSIYCSLFLLSMLPLHLPPMHFHTCRSLARRQG